MKDHRRPSPRDEYLSMVELPDPDDQEYFNRLDVAEEAEQPAPRPLFWRGLAALLVVTFLLYFSGQWFSWWSWPNLGFLQESAGLKEERQLDAANQAIVELESFSPGREGSRRGTGFNVLADGLIVTNAHLVEGSRQVSVRFPDGRHYFAQSWTIHDTMDLAVLDITGEGFPVIPPVWTDSPQPGDALTVLGNPLGFPRVAVAVTMLGMARMEGETWVYVLEGPIYPGSSGSPVLNDRGQAVAVVFAVLSNEGEGIRGLAVPIGHLQGFF